MNIRMRLVTFAFAGVSGSQAHAHHSFAAEFSYDLSGTITGEVAEVLFVNPAHRKNEDGAGQLGGCAEADLCRAGARPDPRSSDGIVLAAAPRAHE